MLVALEITLHRWTVVEVEVPDNASDEQAMEVAVKDSETSTDWNEAKEIYILDKVVPS